MAIDDPYDKMLPPYRLRNIRASGGYSNTRFRVPIYRDEAGITLDGRTVRKTYKELGITEYPVKVSGGSRKSRS